MATLAEILESLDTNGAGDITAVVLQQAVTDIWNRAVIDGAPNGNVVVFATDGATTGVMSDSLVSLATIQSDITGKQADLGLIAPVKDTLVNRPASPVIGQMHFDTDNLGRPLWFDGVAWVDYAGTVVA